MGTVAPAVTAEGASSWLTRRCGDSALCRDSGDWGRAPAGASCSARWPPRRPEVAAGAAPALQRGCVGGAGGGSGVPACGRELVGSAGLLRLPCWPWAPSGQLWLSLGDRPRSRSAPGCVTAPGARPPPCLAASVRLPTQCSRALRTSAPHPASLSQKEELFQLWSSLLALSSTSLGDGTRQHSDAAVLFMGGTLEGFLFHQVAEIL